MEISSNKEKRYFMHEDNKLEVATPYAPPLSGRGYHAVIWRSHGHSVAAYL